MLCYAKIGKVCIYQFLKEVLISYGSAGVSGGDSLDAYTHNLDNSVRIFHEAHLVVDDGGYSLFVVHGVEFQSF